MRKQTLKQNKSGSALISVICVLCIIAGLMLSMTMASFQVLAHAQDAATKEQCRLSAAAFDQVFQEQMKSKGGKRGTLPYQLAWGIVRDGWEYYNELESNHSDKAAVTREIAVSFPEQEAKYTGVITVNAYWKSDKDQPTAEYQDAVMVIRITCTLRNQTYSITREYSPQKIDIGVGFENLENWFWETV